jgi:hypothetical protein
MTPSLVPAAALAVESIEDAVAGAGGVAIDTLPLVIFPNELLVLDISFIIKK